MPSDKYFDVLKKVVAAQNGEIADQLKNGGMQYRIIYGLSLIDLRNIASKFYPDMELADDLWKKDVREFKVLSLLIDDPDKIDAERALSRANDFTNIELAEQAGGYLFPKLRKEVIHLLVPQLLTHENEYAKCSGYILIGSLVKNKMEIEDEVLANYLENAINDAPNASLPLARSISAALRLVGRKNLFLNNKASEVLSEIIQTGTKLAQWLEEDVQFELDFYKERFNKK